MAKKETAEQKLLRIIEASQGAGMASSPSGVAAGQLAQEVAHAVKGSGLPAFADLFGNFFGFFRAKMSASSAFSFGPREINKILTTGLAFLLCAFAINLFFGARLLNKKIILTLADMKTVSSETSFVPAVAAIADYLVNIQKRNIFEPYERKATEALPALPSGSHVSVMTKNLRLAGISWLDSAESVSAMIEDTESGTTRFLKVGDKINDMTVKQIYADRVVLSYEGEELILKL